MKQTTLQYQTSNLNQTAKYLMSWPSYSSSQKSNLLNFESNFLLFCHCSAELYPDSFYIMKGSVTSDRRDLILNLFHI